MLIISFRLCSVIDCLISVATWSCLLLSFVNVNYKILDYCLPWEDDNFVYPPNFARPLEIAIGASDGASDYGNKFGEPLLTGFARSFGLRLPNGERREWVKSIMFSGGIGALDHFHVTKETAQVGKW